MSMIETKASAFDTTLFHTLQQSLVTAVVEPKRVRVMKYCAQCSHNGCAFEAVDASTTGRIYAGKLRQIGALSRKWSICSVQVLWKCM